MPNSRRCCPIPQRREWKSSFSKCRTRNRYVSAQCTFFHSWNKVVRGREMVPLIEELFSSIRRQRRETDDRSCVPVRFFLYFSFFVSFFAYLFEGSSPKLSVKIRDHRCWRGWRVFDAERMEGKHWREKKKKKCGRSLTSAWECAWSWGRAIGRGCTLERIMKGKRELMGPRWPVPRSPFFIYYPPLAFYLRVYLLVTPFSPRS